MRVIDADKMISDTLAMKKNIAEAIECDGIVKYLEENSFDISSIDIKDGDTIIVTIARHDHSVCELRTIAESVKTALKGCFPNNEVLITTDDSDIKAENSYATPCRLDDVFYYPHYVTWRNANYEKCSREYIDTLKVCSLTLKHDGTWNIMVSSQDQFKGAVSKCTAADIGKTIFKTMQEAKDKLEELKNE